MNSELDKIFIETLKLDPNGLQDELTMGQVESWDSLQHMDLIVAIEEHFGIMFSGDEIVDMVSVGAIRRLVADKVKG